MAAVFANLPVIFELAFEEVSFTAVALEKDVLRLDDAFFRRNGFYALTLLVEPGHRNAGKRSTRDPQIPQIRFVGMVQLENTPKALAVSAQGSSLARTLGSESREYSNPEWVLRKYLL